MNKINNNLLVLDEEVVSINEEALKDEKYNYNINKKNLNKLKIKLDNNIPYPDTEKYSMPIGYDDRDRLKFEQYQNQQYWDKLKKLQKYIKAVIFIVVI